MVCLPKPVPYSRGSSVSCLLTLNLQPGELTQNHNDTSSFHVVQTVRRQLLKRALCASVAALALPVTLSTAALSKCIIAANGVVFRTS